MVWTIECSTCSERSSASDIVDLLNNHTEASGWFRCDRGHQAYIQKSFDLQEPGHRWEPFLRGAVRLAPPSDTYQPFVFLVSNKRDGAVTDVWFSYYKDLRESGGRLKLGYGPGGPPVLGTTEVLKLVQRLVTLGLVPAEAVHALVVSSVNPRHTRFE